MNTIPLLLALLLACPVLLFAGGKQEPEIRPVNVVRQAIDVPLPAASERPAELEVRFGAGQLSVVPGSKRALVSGQASYNNELFTPTVRHEGRRAILSAGDGRLEMAEFLDSWKKVRDHLNRWELELAPVPLELELDLGASSSTLELGGLPLTRLRVSQGAADLALSFDKPNPQVMGLLALHSGASRCTLRDLANANAERVELNGGAGKFVLDFGGRLRRDLFVEVEAGAGEVTLSVPEGTAIEVTTHTGLASVDIRGTWNRSETGVYRHASAKAGPKITVDASIVAGKLRLLAGE